MRRTAMLPLAIAALLLLLLAGCGAHPLPEGMEEETVGNAAQAVVDQLNAGDYQGVADAFRADLREELEITADTVKAAMDTAAEAGAYVRTTDILAVGGDRKKFDEPYGVAIVYSEHEAKDVIYELSFDTDMELIGLGVKQK